MAKCNTTSGPPIPLGGSAIQQDIPDGGSSKKYFVVSNSFTAFSIAFPMILFILKKFVGIFFEIATADGCPRKPDVVEK